MKFRTYTGINIQWPISEEITSGRKTIETRTYSLPEKYINQEMLLIETPGKSQAFKSRIVAIIQFTSSTEYKSKAEFYKDTHKHLVDKDSPWAWKDKKKYGWEVRVIKKFPSPIEFSKKKGIVFTTNISLPKLLQ